MTFENEIISYLEMSVREGISLQRGMNFSIKPDYSIILMSLRPNAPYQDEILEDGRVLVYEGHDVPKTKDVFNPKDLDQPQYTPFGKLTENGKFHKAAQYFKAGKRSPQLVKVYEKIKKGIWTYNGLFKLTDAWVENDGRRNVFRFCLKISENQDQLSDQPVERALGNEPTRIIPSSVKLEVWKRDEGKCVECGATNELHFDHNIPFSKGGTSLKAENIQLLCARHNLQKRNRIL